MKGPARYCVVFHFHQPPYDDETMGYYDECYEQSYGTHLDALDAAPGVKVNYNMTGILLETIKQNNPQFIDRLGEKVGSGQVYLTACGYTHPIFPIILERLGKDACKIQIERDLEIKEKLFGVEPKILRLPEYAVSDDVVYLLQEFGFTGTIIPDFVFHEKGIDTKHVLERLGLRMAARNNYLSTALAGGEYEKYKNYFKWMKDYGGTPEEVADDFTKKLLSAESILTDFDGECYNHWVIAHGIPIDKRNILETVYKTILDKGIEMLHLPEFMDSAPTEEVDEIPRVSYDKEKVLSLWEGEPKHDGMWADIERCWDMYLGSGDEGVLDLALKSQTSCWTWAVTHNYPQWWLEQAGRYREMIEGMVNVG